MPSVNDHRPGASPEHPDLRDYVSWHAAYDDPESSLSVRLRHVQRAIVDWLNRTSGPVRVLSSCAGQGHDILGVLEERGPQDRARVTGALVEIDPTNVAIARWRIARLSLAVTVVESDAGTTDAYAGLVPADLLLLSGIMGNISAADIERLVYVSRQVWPSLVPGELVHLNASSGPVGMTWTTTMASSSPVPRSRARLTA